MSLDSAIPRSTVAAGVHGQLQKKTRVRGGSPRAKEDAKAGAQPGHAQGAGAQDREEAQGARQGDCQKAKGAGVSREAAGGVRHPQIHKKMRRLMVYGLK